ncbi:hypothetical protein C9374_014053 [Naegleria lovaniensis]|uniref:F-box domain-containing protein n=1 Tax=Naegleria lovaniensis TaxID=51637 RepID=A0AA88GZX2_NAELO|nr:uncharacterized protein C9374_014053 [Naegleria lovaniensis]KAG2389493.1 hypothetical protein C9374_014053 [Naegleria lovaniensis]
MQEDITVCSDDRDDDELFCNDIYQLTPSAFISKYSATSSFSSIPTDVLCYIILQYLDWKTVFKSCLLVSKDFYRKIANNRQLFINLYNELFVMKQEEIDRLTIDYLQQPSSFKHKKIFTSQYYQYYGSSKMYGGLLYPNEHYHFCDDYDYLELNEQVFQSMKSILQKLYVKNCTMTEHKLMLIRKAWENSVSILRKTNGITPSRTLKKNENQALLALIKKIIKDRLFMRKYFNHDLKSKYFGKRTYHYFYNGQSTKRQEAMEMAKNMPDVTQQLEDLFYYADAEQYDGYQWYELEEIVLGYESTFNGVASKFLNFMESNQEVFPLTNIVSLFCHNLVDYESMISCLYNPDPLAFFSLCPNLKAYASRGKYCSFSVIRSNYLSILILVSGGMESKTLSSVLKCHFPQLKHLELWFGDTRYGNEIVCQHLEHLLSEQENGKFPILEYFGIRNCENIHLFVPLIGNCALLSRIRILDLSLSAIALEDIQKLLAILKKRTRGSFPLLEAIDFHRCARVPPEVVEEFIELEVMVDVAHSARYIAVGE